MSAANGFWPNESAVARHPRREECFRRRNGVMRGIQTVHCLTEVFPLGRTVSICDEGTSPTLTADRVNRQCLSRVRGRTPTAALLVAQSDWYRQNMQKQAETQISHWISISAYRKREIYVRAKACGSHCNRARFNEPARSKYRICSHRGACADNSRAQRRSGGA